MIQITHITHIIGIIRRFKKDLDKLLMLFTNVIFKKNKLIKIFITNRTLFIVHWTITRDKTYFYNKKVMFKYCIVKPTIKSFCSL